MTDRISSFTVVLDRDYRDDDVEPLRQAISLFRGVTSVEGNVSDLRQHVAEQRVRNELLQKIYAVMEKD